MRSEEAGDETVALRGTKRASQSLRAHHELCIDVRAPGDENLHHRVVPGLAGVVQRSPAVLFEDWGGDAGRLNERSSRVAADGQRRRATE